MEKEEQDKECRTGRERKREKACLLIAILRKQNYYTQCCVKFSDMSISVIQIYLTIKILILVSFGGSLKRVYDKKKGKISFHLRIVHKML